jgi:hypothetical protein
MQKNTPQNKAKYDSWLTKDLIKSSIKKQTISKVSDIWKSRTDGYTFRLWGHYGCMRL